MIECLCWVGHGGCGGCSGVLGIKHEPSCGYEWNPMCPEHWIESPCPAAEGGYVWKSREWWIERHAQHEAAFVIPWSCPFCNPDNGQQLRDTAERPAMIDDHVYRPDYAGLDPEKQVCTAIGQWGDPCDQKRNQHTRFVVPGSSHIETDHDPALPEQLGMSPPWTVLTEPAPGELQMDEIPATDEFEWFDHCEVNYVESTFNDDSVCFAAWTSTKGDEADHTARKGLINRLMKDRHGSPFEHMWIQFQVTAPIFVWREHHRHRIASYNEESARYRTMRPRFYIPPRRRPMVKVEGTKAMDYIMLEADDDLYAAVKWELKRISRAAYVAYEGLLDRGVVREVARMCLPVNLMSTCIVTMNARALMNFLSLRVKDDAAAYPSNPQWEINQVALEYERHFERLAPITYEAFIQNGRVAP